MIDDKWLRVDSYIVDSALLAGAKQRLNAAIGMGIRKDASGVWSGMEDSFSQFHPDYKSMDFGVFEDVSDFYKHASKASKSTEL
ncbi:hypothetical protein ACFO4O_00190 [Glaciecola siphonariae]|uniref:Uncharacterized protein n=1 Tax=Glaciecola siphonariae TaxID=521012 RepID=A0ABV9LQ26_9ALTE